MNTFKDFGITRTAKAFIGNKISPNLVLGKEIIIHSYKIEPSKFPDKGDRLTLQITYNEEKRIVFTSSKVLMEMLQKIPADGFPFSTTIKQVDDKGYEFT